LKPCETYNQYVPTDRSGISLFLEVRENTWNIKQSKSDRDFKILQEKKIHTFAVKAINVEEIHVYLEETISAMHTHALTHIKQTDILYFSKKNE